MATAFVYIEYNEDKKEWNIYSNKNNLVMEANRPPDNQRKENDSGNKMIGRWLYVTANPIGLAGTNVRTLIFNYLNNKSIQDQEKEILQNLQLVEGQKTMITKIKVITVEQKWLDTQKKPTLMQTTDRGAISTNENLQALREEIMNFPKELAFQMHQYCDRITTLHPDEKKKWNLHGSYENKGTEAWDNMMSNGTIAGYQAAYLAPLEAVLANYDRIRGHTPTGLSTTLDQSNEVTRSIEAVNMFTNSMKELLDALKKDDKNEFLQENRDYFRKWATNQIVEVAYLVSCAEKDTKLSLYKEELKNCLEYLINELSNNIQDIKDKIEVKHSSKALSDLSIYSKDKTKTGVENKGDQDLDKHDDKTHTRGPEKK